MRATSLLPLVLLLALLASLGCARAQAQPLDDDAFLDEVSRAAFLYFVEEAHPVTGLSPDKTSRRDLCSVASMGFGLACFPVGVHNGWITREQGEELTLRALRTLEASNAHKHGIFAHFIDMETGHATDRGYESVASSIDSALLIAGALAAGEYFGGESKEIADRLYRRMDWKAFSNPDKLHQVYMAWEPEDPLDFTTPGEFHHQTWNWYTDEALLIAMLAISAPEPEHRLPQEALLNMIRPVAVVDGKPLVYTWPGTLFTYTFAQCFYDFRILGPDIARVDWWENTKLAIEVNRDWCRSLAGQFATYGEHRWGITASSGPNNSYLVPGCPPRGEAGPIAGGDPMGGLVAPYGAGMSVPWLPADSIAALRHMRDLDVNGKPLWVDPQDGGYGLVDAFNIDEDWVSDEWFGIAKGPMVLCIENHRSGLVWKHFMQNEHIREGARRAGFRGEF